MASIGRVVTQIENASRSYYTSRAKKPSFCSKISPLDKPSTSGIPELNDWLYNGNKLRVAELQRIIHNVPKRRRFGQALDVFNYEWGFVDAHNVLL